jgi:putative ABC transport system permease protein
MNWLEVFRVAARALLRNKTRSFLTTLGMVIGVAAVIAMVAMGEGAKASVAAAFQAMGTNLIILMPGSTQSGGARGGYGTQPTLTWDDLRAIQGESSAVRYAVPVLRLSTQVLSEDQNWTTSVYGTAPEYFDVRNWPMRYGARFTASDVETGSKVVVLGQTVCDQLFGPSANPVGQVVRISNIPFQVVGIADKKGQSAMGQDYDDAVFIPSSTFGAKIRGGLGNFINGTVYISAMSEESTAVAERRVTELLRDRHHIVADADDDFSIRNLAEMQSSQQQSTNTLGALLAGIAAVSLLVGGIGIMNIMLVSVTERTREIGLRMAIGARPNDILTQFLVEALTLATAGGAVGVALGVVVAHRLATNLHWPLLIRPEVVLVAVAFSALVGVGFGLYPAQKASRLDPIDALRYE